MKYRWTSKALAFALLGSSACALLSKSELVDIRYFSPERVNARLDNATPTAARQQGDLWLRLGRVSSSSSLRERIAYRNAAYERGYYEELRWTDRPEIYVRRALGRSLFEAHGMHRVLSGASPTLETEVLAFDDMRLSTGRAVRIQLRVVLFEESGVIFENTITVDRPVVGDKPGIEDVVAAMADALDAVSEEVSLKVGKSLSARSRSRTGNSERAREHELEE
jgi:ABC-type uncharacterized transport system auxiliary subunit